MSLFKRGNVWWYKFRFCGQVIRDSAKTNSKTVARSAEQARRRELEIAVNHIPKRERVPLFSVAAKAWLATKTGLAQRSSERYQQCIDKLLETFSDRLICDIQAQDIGEYQRTRLASLVSPRTVNYEIGTLRGILKQYGLWGQFSDRVKSLRERHDIGRAVSPEEEEKLLAAAKQSRSPALLPLLALAFDTGLRAGEVQALRYQDFSLEWEKGVIVRGELMVRKSKTTAGTGRTVPLTKRVCVSLTLWLSRFPEAVPASYVFPKHKVGIGGDDAEPLVYDVDLSRHMGSWRSAWKTACTTADLTYRWHDLRHTFVSRLAENPNVSEETIRALAGHVSRQMLQRYSHIRVEAKRAAIAVLEPRVPAPVSEAAKPADTKPN
jgi:integrase